MTDDPSYQGATRTFYDTVAAEYHERFGLELDTNPLGRALLDSFAEQVRNAGFGPVADLGCGQGRVTAYLAARGVDAFGIDLSPGMIAQGRRTYPGLRFEVGSMTGLDLADDSLGGVLAWYSIIHTPADRLPLVLAEFHRVLAPGGQLLVAFQVGDEPRHVEWPTLPVSLDFQRWTPERVTELLAEAGFAVTAQLVREPYGHEKVRQAHLLAEKPNRT
ncbi:class I SAM-dependent methyltransferase [Kitasatospora sp. GAS204B]|uniref:class I SAM-dependent methyltransferase n=1 Tax=unclassified Kitasatospora TaxID=2633591 RepID=UPI002474A8A9|nr:class I SAM-dependent methyltransferase [Kitasatospora sp. GAS204B]MDH6121029.1 SAM-dependent methyltransferase [Kitasatospora sp. GAS204B]